MSIRHTRKQSIELEFFGQATININEKPYLIKPSKHLWLLIYLAYRSDWVTREELCSIFFADYDIVTAKERLRTLLNRTTQFSWANIETNDRKIRFLIETDIKKFKTAILERKFELALSIYKDGLLADLTSKIPEIDSWIEDERNHLRELWRKITVKHAIDLQTQGKFAESLILLKKIWHKDWLSEDALQLYLKAAKYCGKIDEALLICTNFSDKLKSEFGLELLPETIELVRKIRSGQNLETLTTNKTIHNSDLPNLLIGRDNELKKILQSTKPVVLVAGEAGIGKTSILKEAFPESIWLYCREGLQNLAYFPIIECLKQNISDLNKLELYKPDLARLMPDIFPDIKPSQMNPEEVKIRIFTALKQSILVICGKKPLIIDDLQWADIFTLEFLQYLSGSEINIYGAYRKEEITKELEKMIIDFNDSVNIVKLNSLDQNTVQKLVALTIKTDKSNEKFSKLVFECSGGNPFFIKQMLQSMIESNNLSKDVDLIVNNPEITISPAIDQLVSRRVRYLSESTQRVLAAASLIGAKFKPDYLHLITGLSEWSVIEAMVEAEKANIIKEDRFIHDLIRQNIRNLIPKQVKALIHKQIAEKLTDQLESMEIAEHWLQAGYPDTACKLWLDIANNVYKFGLYNQVLSIVGLIELNAQDTDLKHQAIFRRIYTLVALGQLDMAESIVNTAISSLEADLYKNIGLISVITELFLRKGKIIEAENYLKKAKIYLIGDLDENIALKILAIQCQILNYSNNFRQVINLIEPEIKLIDIDKINEENNNTYRDLFWTLANAYCLVGDTKKALKIIETHIGLVRRFQPGRLPSYLWFFAATLQGDGEINRAIQTVYEALHLKETILGSETYYGLHSLLAHIYMDRKEYSLSIKHASISAKSENLSIIVYSKIYLITGYFKLNRLQKNKELINRLIAISQDIEADNIKASICITVYKFGSNEQIIEVLSIINHIDKNNVIEENRIYLAEIQQKYPQFQFC